MVSAFYTGCHSSPAAPAITPGGPGPDRFLTAYGQRDSHAVTLQDGRRNGSPRAGKPYGTIGWADIRGMVESPSRLPKDRARFVVLSTYVDHDGRTHAVQRERGVFHGLAVDIDHGNPSLAEVVAAVQAVTGGAAAEVYSSSSSSADKRKWRVLIPLSEPITGADYADTQLALFDLLAGHGLNCDATLSRSAQPVFLPNVPPDRRGPDGQPLFYQYQHVDGAVLNLTADHPILVARESARQRAAAEKAAQAARAADYQSQRLAYVEATGDDFKPIQHFNDHHPVAEMFHRYGFTRSDKGKGSHWKSPLSTSGSFSTEDRGDHWVTVSNWAHAHNVGRISASGMRYGDAFSLFVYFEHGGDAAAAVAAYAAEVRPRRRGADLIDDDQPDPVEPRPAPAGDSRTLADWRAEASTSRAAVVTQPGLHLDTSPTGSGKTHATNAALAVVSSSLTVLPTHANVVERVRELRDDHGIDAVAFPELTAENCQNYAEASRAQSLGLVTGAAVCPGCQFKDGCTYRAEVKQAESSPHRVGTHERLRRSGRAADGVKVVVIDECPETVLYPTLTVKVGLLTQVETLARAIRDHWYSTATHDQKSFAGALLDVVAAIHDTCRKVTDAGAVQVDLTVPHQVPEQWQRLLYQSIREVGVVDGLDADALTLVTKAAAGELDSVEIVTDRTMTGRLHHFVVGSWRTAMPADAAVVMLDATGDAADIAAVAGESVNDCTPAGHIPVSRPVVQITDDISRATSPATVAGCIDAFLAAHPEVQRLGIIGHKPHVEALTDPDAVLLDQAARDRVSKWCWFGQGPDRASNDWHRDCDHLLVLGTPRANPGDYRRWLVRHGLHAAAARPDGDWGPRRWQGETVDGQTVIVDGMGYGDSDWHRAYTAVCRSTLHQSVGRGRAILPHGIPVTVLTAEPTPYPIAPSLTVTPAAIRETVEIVRRASLPAGSPLGAGSAKSPIGSSYRENCASGWVRSGTCTAAIMGAAGIDRRAAQIRLRQCVQAGRLTRPRRGWYALPESSAPQPSPEIAPCNSAPTPSVPAPPRPAVVARPVQAVVITAMPPSPASPAVDVVAACPPAATTTTCTTTAPPSPPAFDDLVALIDERSAIMEHDGGLDRETADLLAREMVLGRDAALVPSPPTVDVVAVDHAALRARQQPYVGAVLGRFPGVVRTPAGQGDPFAASSRPAGRRRPGQCQCGEVDRWVQVPIHNGQSARVDCGKCDRFGWFSVWYGQRLAGPDDDVQAGTRAAKYPVPANLSRHDLPGPAPGGATVAVAAKAAPSDRLSFVAGLVPSPC